MFNEEFITTDNKYGVMHLLNPISIDFINFSANCDGTVLDIGAAFGVATIPILLNNAKVKIIACDISDEHLTTLQNNVIDIEKRQNIKLLNRLTTICNKFPHFDLPENSIDAVLASHILPFLTGVEIEKGIKKLAQILKPNGQLFITSYTIYNQLMKNYIPIYEDRKKNGELWPGEIQDASLFWDKNNSLTNILPKQLNHLEPSLLEGILKKNNFEITYLDYMSLDKEIPPEMKLDGRETIGVKAILRK